MDRESVQRVLRDRRRLQEGRACYPCQQRKVKCDKIQPCRTCQRRGHPEICTFDIPPRESTRRNHPQSTPGRKTSDAAEGQERILVEQRQPAMDMSSPGHDSVSAILSAKVSSPNDEPLARDVRAVLGLQNTLTSYLFAESSGQTNAVDSLTAIAPRGKDVERFYQHYRTHVTPFNPILLNTDRFELDLSVYLKAEAAGDLKDQQRLVEGKWLSRSRLSFIALLLAVLASGAHFSDAAESNNVTHSFATRSFQALRLSNFLFQPSASDIQTLLILGNTLQNIGQSDAAWALLGTTVRLSQTVGSPPPSSDPKTSEEAVTEPQLLRTRVRWQDALLSICHDRPPAIYSHGWSTGPRLPAAADLSYAEVMDQLCCLSIEFMQRKALDLWDKSPTDLLRGVDAAYANGVNYTRDASGCKDLSQLLEHYALKMHVAFTITYICRPAIRNSTPASSQVIHHTLRLRARENLARVCQAFLEFQALSIVPRRTWSMLHEALSAALLLYAWDETRNDPDCRQLQQRVVDVFTTEAVDTISSSSSSSSETRWLSPQHVRTLRTLREVLGQNQQPDASAEQPPGTPAPSASGVHAMTDVFDAVHSYFPLPSSSTDPALDLNAGGVGMDGLSPLDYLNYYMNGPVPGMPDDGYNFM